jgi:hypothetical protein
VAICPVVYRKIIMLCHVSSSRSRHPQSPSTCLLCRRCHRLSLFCPPSQPACCRRPLPPPLQPPRRPPRRPTRDTGSAWPPLLSWQRNTIPRKIRATANPGTPTGRGSARSGVDHTTSPGRPPRRKRETSFHSFLYD